MTTETIPDVPTLLAENARLRAIVDRVEALASGARLHWNSAPRNGTVAVVDKSGGWQDLPLRTRAYVRSDEPGGMVAHDPYFPDSGDWFELSPEADDKPLTWGELNWLDDPECDRGTVSIETYVPLYALDEALADPS
jgi:hypothetical protein